jgi:anti-anti-sigma regulatory factor
MLKIEFKPEAVGQVRLVLAGRMNANSLGELRRAIERARRHRGRVALDLGEVTLADRPSIDFLAQQTRDAIELINCPAYLETWIAREG